MTPGTNGHQRATPSPSGQATAALTFNLASEHAAMGHSLGRIADREYRQTGLRISAVVNYLDANDSGPGSANSPR